MTDEKPIEEKALPVKRMRWVRLGVFFTTLGVIVLILAFGLGYFQLTKVNMTLAKMVTELDHRLLTDQKQMQQLQTSVQELITASSRWQNLEQEQERIVADWQAAQKGNLNKWRVAEAQYLVKLANDHLQLTYEPEKSEKLLESADKILAQVEDGQVITIRKTLAQDILNLQAMPKIDTTSLYLQLVALTKQLDKLPLPESVLQPQQPDTTPNISPDLPWWERAWLHTRDALSKIVIVERSESQALPLVAPSERNYLLQNLYAQLETARWAVLHRNDAIYQASLTDLHTWIKQYFVETASTTQAFLNELTTLQKTHLQLPEALDLSATLTLFDQYFAQTKTLSTGP